MAMKICNICSEPKPLDAFSFLKMGRKVVILYVKLVGVTKRKIGMLITETRLSGRGESGANEPEHIVGSRTG